ncbi:MAG TPA: SDR family NAD(P)-dependent oxidoreductase [Acidimicrobiia bacterium]|nr:SDR family NAD(P)-dependent oxidoreductase [Acidimicrobiia bacterium]
MTGGGGGIGRATARWLVRDGAAVTVAGRTPSKLDAVVDALGDLAAESGGAIRAHVCDANEAEQVRDLVEAAAAPDGRLDIAVAVPGGGTMGPILRMEPSDLERVLRNNIVATFILLKYAGAGMVQHGGGSFVGVSSASGVQSTPMLASYCAAKGGLEMFLRTAADELGRYGVRVNAVGPGLTETDATPGLVNDPEVVRRYMEQQAIQRVGRPDDIAAAIRYFAGPESSWTTGQILTVDGGMVLRRFPDLSPVYEARFADDLVKQSQGIVD